MATVFKRGGRSNKSGYYYVAWQEHTAAGRRRRTKCLKTIDKGKAERIAAKLEGDAALRRDGVIDPALDAIGRESVRTIESHLADFENKLRAANRTDKHVASTLKFIRWVADFASFHTVAQISSDCAS